VPFAYSKGYRIYSAVAHGNSWAIWHCGVTKTRNNDGETVARPGLDAKTMYNMHVLAGRQLVLSLGFAIQFMRGWAPTRARNKVEALIASIHNARRSEMDGSSLHAGESA